MSTSAITSVDPVGELARTLLQTYDTNGDGKLSVEEFSSLLTRLTGSLSASRTSGASSTTATTTPVLSLSTVSTEPKARLMGFDDGKIADTNHKTPKYCFARVALQTSLSGVTDKASAETLLRGLIPQLQTAGLSVLDVQGDKIKISGESGEEWIDVIQGANSGSPAFQWMPV